MIDSAMDFMLPSVNEKNLCFSQSTLNQPLISPTIKVSLKLIFLKNKKKQKKR